jgi:hypothetical protein
MQLYLVTIININYWQYGNKHVPGLAMQFAGIFESDAIAANTENLYISRICNKDPCYFTLWNLKALLKRLMGSLIINK